ncbi:hypothetical protein CORC01_08359 [Colletotrichum orchidophilum]|uniref:Uncharacterized protein n=1 Tax=Colletotrichum orchidophilum TaxID=1209926 RepID=A0A1G4B4G2_9PEZI|nr:uncharacterized protein CORC01_08359 [Colletotrichum orchidophilum]OHE96287.1 hypothetical protein CORC01_08359 [Colletotrichum orchidophilum]
MTTKREAELAEAAYPVLSDVLDSLTEAIVQQNKEGIPPSTDDNVQSILSHDNDVKNVAAKAHDLQIRFESLGQEITSFGKSLTKAPKRHNKLVKKGQWLKREIDQNKAEIQLLEDDIAQSKFHDVTIECILQRDSFPERCAKANVQKRKFKKMMEDTDRIIEAHEAE